MRAEEILIGGTNFVIIHYDDSDNHVLNEANNKGRPLVGSYSYKLHQPHNPTGDYHIHLYDGKNEILSMNKASGKGHDGYTGVRIPNKAFKALKDRFPDWKWPENQILESKDYYFFMPEQHRSQLRRVIVSANAEGNETKLPWDSYFHQFAADFLVAGGQGFVPKTVALIENEDGYIIKIAMDGFRFKDR